jgi:DNA replication and repair protein RecF
MSEAACRVDRLRLFAFRNYAAETVELGSGLNVIAGRNAQGKTNLLEAVATVALTRSPRAATAADVIAWGQPAAHLEAAIHRPAAAVTIDLRLHRSDASERVGRSISLDGRPRPARSVLGLCPVVLFWPEDLLVVKGAPEARRRLCDVVLAQLEPRTAAEMVRFRRVLEQRNALLRRVRAGEASPAPLAGFTEELVRAGGWVRAARARLVAALQPLAAEGLAALSDGSERLGLAYAVDGDGGDPPPADPEAVSEALARTLRQRAGDELARGVTLAGPHRDDVVITLDGRPARAAASQGQQRSIVLAWKLAEVRHLAAATGTTPVLLLDDVLSELDGERRRRLLDELGAGRGTQALLTTSEAGGLDLERHGEVRHMSVEAGRVSVTGETPAGLVGAAGA